MTLVCATDFSPGSFDASDVAARLAARLGERLVLVHAAPGAEPSSSALGGARRALAREADRLAAFGCAVEPVEVDGAPHLAIAEVASRERARLLVVAAASARFAEKTGRTAERIAHVSPVPVLVVRDPAPFSAWLWGERPLRVLFAAGLDASFEAARRLLVELRRVGPCDVVVAHASFPPEDKRRLGLGGGVDLVHGDAEVERVLRRELQGRLGALPGQGEVRIEIRPGFGRVDEHVAQIAAAEEGDLVVVGSHQRSRLDRLRHGAVSEGVLRRASRNVALAPTRWAFAEAPAASARAARVRSVLVASDLSPASDRALAQAYGLVADGGTVHVVHVLEPGRSDDEHRRAYDELRARVPQVAADHGVDTTLDVLDEADAAHAICAAAVRFDADVVCMGTRGRSGLARALLGSVAEGVVRASTKPVVLVRALD